MASFDASLVVPGQPITAEQGYLRGHGSFIEEGSDGMSQLVSCVAGQIERVNKLITVRPIKSRYIGEVGDLVVGRISAVESKRWKADICAQKDATLQLSSVNLPGGVQRMRTYEDQLQMRTLFTENDLVSAEIQNIGSDGMISLHTRSLKYGKLENGQLIIVPSSLVKRLPQHYISFPWGIDVILGRNGYIWITRSVPEEWKNQDENQDDLTPLAETLQRLKQRHATTALLADERTKVARVRNAIAALCKMQLSVSPDTISTVYRLSERLEMHPTAMLNPENVQCLTAELIAER